MEKIFEAFAEKIREEEEKLLGEGFTTEIIKVPKNNGAVQTGLGITEKTSLVTTVIYLEEYFPLYIHGEPISGLAREIYETCQIQKAQREVKRKVDSMQDFSLARENIVCRLVNYKMNEKRLLQLPHILITDLAVIFYVYMGDYTDGRLFSVITNQLMGHWGTPPDGLLPLAMENTQRLSPVQFNSMGELLEEAGTGWQLPEEPDSFLPGYGLYVLTNTQRQNGAVSILYPGMLKQIAEKLEDDLVIIPSSLHEVILAPYQGGWMLNKIEEIIMEVNREEVALSERLSTHAYTYRQHSNQIHAVLNGKEVFPGFPLGQLCPDK